MTVAEALAQGTRQLAVAGVPDPARDVRRLLAHALDCSADRLTLISADPVSEVAAQRFAAALTARIERRPVSQIVGWREFYGRRFAVTPDVLDPRPETELLVDLALAEPFDAVLDLGTGSGCLLLTLMAERPGVAGTGTDISEPALALAARNAEVLGLAAELRLADWFAGMTGRWPLIVSNPPYIAEGELPDLAPEVRLWEPRHALSPGSDGLGAYRAIAAAAAEHLAPGGRLVVEIGHRQAAEVAALLAAGGLADIAVHPDLDGRDRAVIGRNPA